MNYENFLKPDYIFRSQLKMGINKKILLYLFEWPQMFKYPSHNLLGEERGRLFWSLKFSPKHVKLYAKQKSS